MDVTIVEQVPDEVTLPHEAPSFRQVFDAHGRLVGHQLPRRRGIYMVREKQKTTKQIVR